MPELKYELEERDHLALELIWQDVSRQMGPIVEAKNRVMTEAHRNMARLLKLTHDVEVSDDCVLGSLPPPAHTITVQTPDEKPLPEE